MFVVQWCTFQNNPRGVVDVKEAGEGEEVSPEHTVIMPAQFVKWVQGVCSRNLQIRQ